MAVPVNVASVPQRSPLRFPGGKTWLVPKIRAWLDVIGKRPLWFVEPFAGGATATLTAIAENKAERGLICEIDPAIAGFWLAVISEGDALAERILAFKPTRENILGELEASGGTRLDYAFRTLLRNRAARGGVMAKGASLMLTGENGKGITSRWYPETLARRIHNIFAMRDRLSVFQGCGLSLMSAMKQEKKAVWFIDPPYTAGKKAAGRRLYDYHEMNHEDLFDRVRATKGPALCTYNESSAIRRLAAKHGFLVRRVPMKNGHHAVMSELLVFKGKPC